LAILADDSKKFGMWDVNEFFETGRQEVDAVLSTVEAFNLPAQHASALDFGCGVGRLSRTIRRRFQACVGVDISPAMIDLARKFNPDCEFHLLGERGLADLEDEQFDFIYSNIVLQHQPSQAAVFGYIADFIRLLRAGGVLVFQVPHYIPFRMRLEPRRRLYRVCRGLFRLPPDFIYNKLKLNPITMLAIPEASVIRTIASLGGEVLHIRHDKNGGPRVQSRTYFVTKHSMNGSSTA
jgi:SAM-dependent methyltransferase